MIPTSLIKETPERQQLFRLFFPPDPTGTHEVRYGLTATDYNNGDLSAGLGTRPSVIATSTEEQLFLQSVLTRLASIINIRPIQINSLTSPLQFVSVQTVRDDGGDPNVSGITYSGFTWETFAGALTKVLPRPSSYITVEFELNDDAGLSDSEKRTIVHETGHVFGLDHPGGDATDPAYDDADTIMSYNQAGDKPATWFSTDDITALKEVWGEAKAGSGDASSPKLSYIDSITGQVINGFQSGRDKLLLSVSNLPGLKRLSLVTVTGSRKTFNRRGLQSSSPLVYWRNTGEVYLNANGKLKGLGIGGGMLADIGDLTPLAPSDLILV